MIFYEIYNYLQGKGKLVDHLNSKTEEMKSKSLSKCFIELVTKDSEDIAKRFKLITVQPIDLAWEPHLLGLKSCKQAECERWKLDDISTRLSTLRREKMISISTSLISWKTNICYAMECHLYNIITNEKKFQNDIDYRNDQILRLSFKQRLGGPFIDCRRIVVIHKEKWNKIVNNDAFLEKTKEYLQWHINNHWEMILYIIDDGIEVKLSVLGNMIIDYDELTDFIIIGNINDDNVVFAQNSKEMAQVIKDNKTYEKYKKWYNKAWRSLHCGVIERQVIDNSYINKLFI